MATSSKNKKRSSGDQKTAQGRALVMAEDNGRESEGFENFTEGMDAPSTMGCIPIVSAPGSAGSGSVVNCQISVQPSPSMPTQIAIGITPGNAVLPYTRGIMADNAGPFPYSFQLAAGFLGTVTLTATIGTNQDGRNIRVS